VSSVQVTKTSRFFKTSSRCERQWNELSGDALRIDEHIAQLAMSSRSHAGSETSTTARVWVSQRKDEWEAAEVVHRTMEAIEVILSGSKQRRTFDLTQTAVVPRNPAHLEGTHDLVTLQFLDEPNILHNLRVRHKSEEIYTNTGPILIAINPWRTLDIYSAQFMDKYNSSHLDRVGMCKQYYVGRCNGVGTKHI